MGSESGPSALSTQSSETPTPSPRRLLKDYFTPLFFGRGLSCPLSYLS